MIVFFFSNSFSDFLLNKFGLQDKDLFLIMISCNTLFFIKMTMICKSFKKNDFFLKIYGLFLCFKHTNKSNVAIR